MTTTDPYAGFGTRQTHQQHRAPDRPEQVKNNAGGYVFQIDPLTQLKRFLTIGTVGGSYYVGEKELTRENGEMILSFTRNPTTHAQLVDTIVEISLAGRAPKQNPTLFALAIACQHGDTASKQYARKQLTKVVRTGTHLFLFVGYVRQFGGWNRGMRRAIGAWYSEKDPDKLAYQLIKYRRRNDLTHRDVLRMAHPKIKMDEVNERIAMLDAAFRANEDDPNTKELMADALRARNERLKLRSNIDWTIKYQNRDYSALEGGTSKIIEAFEACWREPENIPAIISDNPGLPWEALPDEALTKVETWDRLLDNGMPIHALLRQLPRLTNLGMLPPMGAGRTDDVIHQLLNREALERARMHPINVLVALKTYASGQGERNHWSPNTKIIDALDEMFYRSFGFIEPTGKRILQACDISYSMMGARTFGGKKPFPLSPAEITGAMALATAHIEPNHHIVGFSSLSGQNNRDPRDSKLIDLNISKRQRMDDVINTMYNRTFGGTDVALPMVAALEHGWKIDTFVIYTDNETWHGDIHPHQALERYRRQTGIDARLVVCAMSASHFSVADPKDPRQLDISGFDSAMPQLISEFSAGNI